MVRLIISHQIRFSLSLLRLHCKHYSSCDGGVSQQGVFNFREFNSMTTDFYLEISTAFVFQFTLQCQFDQIAGFIQPLLCLWMKDKTLCGQLWPVQITPGYTCTAYI